MFYEDVLSQEHISSFEGQTGGRYGHIRKSKQKNIVSEVREERSNWICQDLMDHFVLGKAEFKKTGRGLGWEI